MRETLSYGVEYASDIQSTFSFDPLPEAEGLPCALFGAVDDRWLLASTAPLSYEENTRLRDGNKQTFNFTSCTSATAPGDRVGSEPASSLCPSPRAGAESTGSAGLLGDTSWTLFG